MLLGLGEWARRGASRSVIIPHLQVFLLPWSLSSLVKRKSICTDVYEKGDCLVERKKKKKKSQAKMYSRKMDKSFGKSRKRCFVCAFVWSYLAAATDVLRRLAGCVSEARRKKTTQGEKKCRE